jgi:protein CpxP
MRGVVVLGFCLSLGLPSEAFAQSGQDKLRQLHGDLHLTAEQEGTWRNYTAAIMPDAQAKARREAAEQLLPQLTTPRRVALVDAISAQDEADLHRRGEIVNTFYASLSPDQQHTFDRETVPSGVGQSGR